ncbi:MAG: NFACT RNA binding domain-containing protein [bacterium]
MFNNHLLLKRHLAELSNIIIGLTAEEVFTQEKDTLFISAGNSIFPYFHLIISANANAPYIISKQEHHKAKKNTILFFDKYFPAKIKDIHFCVNDRIIKIIFNTGILYFFYSGPKTNVLFVANDEVLSFKKIDESDYNIKIGEFNSLEFLNPNNQFTLAHSKNVENNIKNVYETKRFKKELEIRKIKFPLIAVEQLKTEIIENILQNRIIVFYDKTLNSVLLQPEGFFISDTAVAIKFFSNVNDSIHYYLSLQQKYHSLINLKLQIGRYLEKELIKLSDKLNNLKNRIDNGSKEEVYKHFGNLLLYNINSYKKTSDQVIEVFDYNIEKWISISINSKFNYQKNIDLFFDKARNEKISYNKSIDLFNMTEIKYKKILRIKNDFDKTEEIKDLIKLKDDLKLGSDKQPEYNNEKQFNFKTYLCCGKYKIYVGKDSTNNDLLTTKFAKQNDYWFHVRGASGSHVILRVDNTKEIVPKNVLKSVASLTAYHSKAKTAGTVPVVYTLKKYVVKKKGMNVGQVVLLKEDVLLVKPEIPADCEFISSTDE